MPANANVFVHYGPYKSCCVVDHSTHRLDGLKNVLQNDGHKVDYVQITDWNTVELWVNGQMIFKTDTKELDFGGDGELDGLCSEALKKVREAF